jgi:hypothetical protein
MSSCPGNRVRLYVLQREPNALVILYSTSAHALPFL